MATLKTTDGVQYYFDSSSVLAVSDRNPSTGQAVTCIYGLSTRASLPIAESAQAFMAGLNPPVKFGQVTGPTTGPDQTNYWINLSAVVSICSDTAGEYPGTNAVVLAGSTNFAVSDSPQDAANTLLVSP